MNRQEIIKIEEKIKNIEESINDKKGILIKTCDFSLAIKIRQDIRELEDEIKKLTHQLQEDVE